MLEVKGCPYRHVPLPFVSGKGGKFLSGKDKGTPPWVAHPIHNLVKSPPPLHSGVAERAMNIGHGAHPRF